MDSITQATLGAACGELVLGRRLGNKALVWGAALGTLPDLDVIVYPLLDGVERIGFHRGISHSIVFCVALAPALGLLVGRVHQGAVSAARASWFAFLVLSTHVLIDCFTVYGTQALEPFASTRVAWNNLFIIDPLFTAPMLLGLVIAPWLNRASQLRLRAVGLGVTLSSVYVLASFGLKAFADARFAAAIADEGFATERWMTAPMPLTTLYWRCVVDEGERFRVGHVSVFDDADAAIRWRTVERRSELVDSYRDTRGFETIRWFSDDWWAARTNSDGELIVADLRFGDVHGERTEGTDSDPGFVFDFELLDDGRDARLHMNRIRDVGPALAHVLRRALGEPP